MPDLEPRAARLLALLARVEEASAAEIAAELGMLERQADVLVRWLARAGRVTSCRRLVVALDGSGRPRAQRREFWRLP